MLPQRKTPTSKPAAFSSIPVTATPTPLAALALALLTFAKPGVATADEPVDLAWDGVTGAEWYEVHYGQTSRPANCEPESCYDAQQRTQNTPPETTMTVPDSGPGLTAGATYYFAVRACRLDANADAECSAFSNEISTTIPLPLDTDGDGIADWADPDPLDADVGLPPVYPATTMAQADANWAVIDAPSGYLDAVVIAGPPSYNDTHPGVVRVNNVTDRGFDLRFQEWGGGDNTHAAEDIPYLVLQPGRHTLPDGSIWEVGTINLGGTGDWSTFYFSDAFASPPHLFLTLQTYNGSEAVTPRARNVTSDGFDAALFEEEALMNGHNVETVAYLAVTSPTGSGRIDTGDAQAPYLLQRLTADERWTPVLSQRLMLQEEQSRDSETNHTDEQLDVIALGNQLFAQSVSFNGGDTKALRRLPPTTDAPMEWGLIHGIDHTWETLPFAKTYTDPVLVIKPVSTNGPDRGVIRIRNLSADGAQLRYQEWTNHDGPHPNLEDVFYMVAEAGEHQLGGLTVEADRLATNALASLGQWSLVDFNATLINPVVFASVLSYQGGDPVTTRVQNLDLTGIAVGPSGMAIAMDEQESLGDGHVQEQLGWIAIEQGSGATTEGRRLSVFSHQVDDLATTLGYPATTHRVPTVLGDINSAYELDPVTLRFANQTNTQITLRLSEDTSADAETDHLPEDVGLFVGE